MADIRINPHYGRVGLAIPALPRVDPRTTGWGVAAGAFGIAAQVTGEMAEKRARTEAADAALKAVQDFDAFQRELQQDDDWQGYEAKTEAFWSRWTNENTKGMSYLGREAAQEQLQTIRTRTTLSIRDDAEKKRRDLSRADFITRYNEGLASLATDPTGLGYEQLKLTFSLLDEKGEAGDFTAEEVAKLKASAGSEMGAAYVRGWIAINPGKAMAILQDPSADGMTKHLDPSALRVLKGEAEREIAKRNAAAAAAVQRDQQLAAMSLEIAVSRGEAGEAEIYDALEKRIVSPSAAASLVIKADKVKADGQTALVLKARVNDAVTGSGPPLSPGNADDRQAVDLAFADFSSGINDLSPDEQASATVAWIARTGIAPSAVTDFLRSGARGNTEQVLEAADLLGRLQDQAPLVAQSLDGSDYTFLATVQNYVETGLPGPRAVAQATADVKTAGAPEQTERREQWSADAGKLEKQARKWFAGKVGDSGFIFGGSTDLPDGMVGEFVERAERYYLDTGNLDAAQAMALKDAEATWGKSRVGGEERWMQYPPEAVYGNGTKADAEWMTRQLHTDLTIHRLGALGSGQPLPEDLDKFWLVPTPETSRSARPGYFVEYLRDDGVIELLVDPKTGMPLLWRPDWSSSPSAAEAAKAVEQAEADARKHRETIEKTQDSGAYGHTMTIVPTFD